jgi:type IX secretion system PorP/SprF family membrane protein
MKKILLALVALAVSTTIAFAQNDFVLTEQLFSRIAVNPAGTGNDPNVNIFSLNRFQYAGAQGAPFSTLLNVHSYFDKANSGVGFTFSYDGSGIAYRQFQAKAVYAYHLNFGKKNLFSFGVGLGIASKNFDPNRHILVDEEERGEGFPDEYQSKTSFDASIGIEYSNPFIMAGFSINHIPGYFVSQEDMNSLTIMPTYHLYARGMIDVMDQLRISPSAGYYYSGQTHVADVNVTAFFCNYFWAGLGYRTLSTAYLNIGVEWEWLRVGYSCDLNAGQLSDVAWTSHEVMLSFSIPTQKHKSEWDD